MKRMIITLFLLAITAYPVLAAPTNTSDSWGIDAAGFKNLSTCLASPSTAGKTVVITKPMAINNKTVSGNRFVKIINGGRIDTASGKMLTFADDSSFDTGRHITFGGSGTVTGLKEARPEWWRNNTTRGTDMTAAIIAAATCAKASKGTLILAGDYAVTKVRLYDAIDYSIRSDNATLTAISSTAQTAVLEIDNAYNFRMSGALTILGHITYDSGLRLTTSVGSIFRPDYGFMSRVNIRDITFRGCKLAVSIGKYIVDAQLAEIVFNNIEMIGCPAAVYIAGTQTGTSFVGCNLVSEPSSYYPGAPEYVILNEGAFVSVVGGEITLTSGQTALATLLLQPGSSKLYQSPYGALRLVGVHIETGATPLFRIYNPRAITSPTSLQSHIVFTGCGGYVGSNPIATVGIITDATYVGSVQARNNNFYIGISESPRTASTIDAGTSLAKIEVDKSSFGFGFLPWMEGINGGILLHEMINGVQADNLVAHKIGSGVTATLPFAVKKKVGNFKRYAKSYNASTGVFTVPAGGLKYASVKASAKATAGVPATIALYKNGIIDVTGTIIGQAMNVTGDYSNLVAGDTLEVRVTNNAGAPLTFEAADSDRITIYIQN